MARKQSSAAWAVALVIAGTGFFVFMILFIVFFTQNAKFEQDAAAARKQLDVFANNAQRNSNDVQQIIEKLEGGKTVVSSLLDDVGRLKAMITADTSLTVEAIGDLKVEQQKIQTTLLKHVEVLEQELAAAREQAQTARNAQADAERRTAVAISERDAVAEKFKTDLERVTAGFAATGATLKGATDGYGAMTRQIREEMAQIRQQSLEAIAAKEARVEELEGRLQVAEARLRQFERKEGEVLGAPDIESADAFVVSLAADEGRVYLNRGSDDHLQLGMTFEVFGAEELVKRNDFDELRGKATVEIMNMEPATAVARIVRQRRGDAIVVGDQVVNVAYDPNAELKFHVFGDFDIDNIGAVSTGDRERIKSMVVRWGGTVSDELNWDVDYLVLGRQPRLPDPLDDDEIDPVVIRRHAEEMKNWETYNRLSDTARALSVPVLNQNRFLALIGYYRR